MLTTKTATAYVYERIADALSLQIENGMLKVGDRLPSVREICRREKVSPGSAMQALALLESRGLVQARPRSGFYVRTRRMEAAPQPPPPDCSVSPGPVTVSELVVQVYREAGREDMVPLGAAMPSPELLPTDTLSRCVAAAVREEPQWLGKYSISHGHPRFLRQLALRHASFGLHIAPDEFTATFGAMEALNLAIRAVTRPGEIIAVESPCYFGILELLESMGIRALPIPSTCEHGIDLALLEQAIEEHDIKGLVLVTSFSNPNGNCLPQAKRLDLLNLLADHEIPLVEDDVYGDLHFGPERPRPAKAFDQHGLVMYCGSFSKSLSPGLRIGWIAAGRYTERVRRLKYINTVTTPAVPQIALARYLESGAMDRRLRQLRRNYQTQVDATSEAILDYFPPGVAVSKPEGGCFLWVQLPHGVDAVDLQRRAAKDAISIAPGQIFSPRADISDRVRISCAHPVTETLRQAIRKLGAHVRDLTYENASGSLTG